MPLLRAALLFLGCCYLLTGLAVAEPALPDVGGSWHGTLNAGSVELVLQFDLARDAAGNYTGTLISLSQNNAKLPITSVTFEGSGIEILVPAVDGRFTGYLETGGEQMTGTWMQGGQQLALVLTRGQAPAVAPPPRPQHPIPPYPYTELTVTIPTSTPGVTLAGTLTTPSAGTGWPAVILVSGSGGQDRDETLFGHKPFLVIADHLTRHGIAVLRYDDRGIGQSTGDPNGTTLDFALDAIAAHTFLRSHMGIDPARVGVIGHSEGALIGAILAAEYPDDIAFLIGLAGTGIPGRDLMPLQGRALMLAGGASPATAEWSATAWTEFGQILARESDDEVAKADIGVMVSNAFLAAPAEVQRELGTIEFHAGQMTGFVGPWFRTFLGLDPDIYHGALGCPVLMLHGDKDCQVPAAENQAAMRVVFEASAHPDFALEVIPHANHLFQTAQTGSPQEYGLIEETIMPIVLERMVSFIQDH